MDNCISCQTKLISDIDDDDAVCVKCRAEDEHDFDLEPNVRFNRLGRMINQVCAGSVSYL